jgi:hypothetical protein
MAGFPTVFESMLAPLLLPVQFGPPFEIKLTLSEEQRQQVPSRCIIIVGRNYPEYTEQSNFL